jgi:TPR repeat protein
MAGRKIYYLRALKKAELKEPDYLAVYKDLVTALEKEGDPRAAYAIATWYLSGLHVKKDCKKAVELLTIAANFDIPDACFDLAICFEKGNGVIKNLEKSFYYYMKGALAGDPQSHYETGRCYYHGIGVKKNKDLGEILLKKAERLGITT